MIRYLNISTCSREWPSSKSGDDGVDTVFLHETIMYLHLSAGPVPNFINIILEFAEDSKQQDVICMQGYFDVISDVDLGKIVNIDQKKKETKNSACGTPEITGVGKEDSPLTTYNRFGMTIARYPLTQCSMWSLKPRFSSFFSRGK